MAPYDKAPETGTRNARPAGRGAGAGALVGGALFVGLIAVCALVISYNGVFRFAEYGGHRGSPLAHVFPVTYTLLLLMAFWVSYVLREAHPRDRMWVDLVLIPLLILVAATAMVLSNLGLVETVHQGVANVIVAVAPLAALLIAFLLWMTVRAHIRRRRRATPPRPRPWADRATVLHGRAVSPSELDDTAPDDDHLTTRLLDFGPAPAPEPLPRRTRTGANPIKQASAEVPVVPGAAAPPVDPRESDAPDTGPDDGFQDDAPPGDPASDEAEAPPATAVREPEPGVHATNAVPAVRDDARDREATAPGADSPGSEPEPLRAEPEAGPREPEDSPIPDTALWEPPADGPDGDAVTDYVPAVWTPPEDTGPSPLAEEVAEAVPEPTPVLDHGTGPDVRAALRIDSVPPGAAAPEPEEPDPEFDPTPDPEFPPEPAGDPVPEPEPDPEPDAAEPPADPARADDGRRPPLAKRPMVLKPRRPPMPDLTAGPPSGRVRSEPLPPGD